MSGATLAKVTDEKNDAKAAARLGRWGPLLAALIDAYKPYDGKDSATKVDVSRVGDRLYLGSLGAARNLRWQKHAGVTHILSVMQDWTSANVDADCANPEEYKFQLGIKRKYVPVCDNFSTDMRRYFSNCFHWIEKALNCGGTVLVHCHMGISRSATILCSYLMRKNRWNFDDTLRFLKGRRRCVCPNDGFVAQLKAFEKERERVNWKKQASALIRALCSTRPRFPFQISTLIATFI